MTEKMSREKAEWSPEWLTIREFIHITPVNLFHKEQEEGEKQLLENQAKNEQD